MIYGGRIGEVRETWVNVGGPSGPCNFAPEEVPPDVDWNMWLGSAPWRPFQRSLLKGNFNCRLLSLDGRPAEGLRYVLRPMP
jgi:hypothetical protein